MNVPQTSVVLFLSLGGPLLFGQTSQTSDPAPLSNEVNSQLPDWLRFGGEERARMQYILGENFKSVDDHYLLNRLRLNMDVYAAKWLQFHFQAQDSRVFWQNTVPAPASQKDAMDLREGYVQFGSEETPLTFRAGRQGLDFGDGRLLMDGNWSNVGLTFDAARLTLRHNQLKLDLFSGASVKINQTSDLSLDTPGEHFDGAYASLGGLAPGATIEPYVLWRMEHNCKNQEGKYGDVDEKTIGLRWTGKLPDGFDYASEVAGQVGSYAGDSIGAWMGHWVVGHTLPDARHRPRFFIELNRASGQNRLKDGSHGTFDPMFWGSHDKYGLTDLVSSSNIVHLRPGFQYAMRPALTVGLAYDDFWLASARDGLYVSGKLFVQNANGAAGTHVGQEVDVQSQWTVNRAMQVTAGYGRLFPGEFLEKTTAGVPYNLLFLNVAQRF